jgi:hypothetical protein
MIGMSRPCIALVVILGICASFAAAEDNVLTPREKDQGWKLLFDGTTFTGWDLAKTDPKLWKLEDGAIASVPTGGAYLYSTEQYSDFIISLDFKVDRGANSGLFYRIGDPDDPVGTGQEIQILDSSEKARPDVHDCGALYECLAPAFNAERPVGEWQTMVVYAKDNIVGIVLNGFPILTADLNLWTQAHKNPDGSGNKFPTAYKDMPRAGLFGLQNHGSNVWFKNIKLLPLAK